MSKSKSTTPTGGSMSQTVSRLLEISNLDTVFRELYFQWARELMETSLSQSDYVRIRENQASVGGVERQLKAAVERSDWVRAQELTNRVRALRGSGEGKGELLRLGETLYDGTADITLDPFSPGLQSFVGASNQKLEEFRRQATEILHTLERIDSSRKDFYAGRRADFQSLNINIKASTEVKDEKKPVATSGQLQQQAIQAVESGDLSLLDRLVKEMMNKPAAQEVKQESGETLSPEAAELGDDLLYSFSEATLASASRLGLTPVRTGSRRQFAYLLAHYWQPEFLKDESKQQSLERLRRVNYPSGVAVKAKDAMEFFLANPFINSGGARYIPCLVIEDLMIEDFAEPEPKEELPQTELLKALGLESRRNLSRIDLENALYQNGPRIVRDELSLEPEAFRLVAIPADIYTHLAAGRGWGQKQIWTHFDGYQILEQGKYRALAGGDERFGGTHDVVSFGRNYAQERIIARFAVVQRKRMMSWQGKGA